MREILFKGMRVDDSVFVEGFVFVGSERTVWIHPANESAIYYVKPDTVGEFSGVLDKTEKYIFEGDLVTANLPGTVSQQPFSWGICEVIFKDGCFGLQTSREFIPFWSFAPTVEFEVVGNIHDKKEQNND